MGLVLSAPAQAPASPAGRRADTVAPDTPPALRDGVGGALGGSFGSIVPTIFAWKRRWSSPPAQAVYVTGAWDGWLAKTPLHLAAGVDGEEFSAVISLPVGSYQYKYIVDGNWRHASALTTETDAHGNLNNIVLVSPHLPEYDSNQPPAGAGGPPSPIESYDFSMPASEDYSVEPMALPVLFKALHPDPPLPPARAPRFNPSAAAALNHTYGVADSYPAAPVRTLATVTRYKRSTFVTTVLVMTAVDAPVPTAPISIPVPIPVATAASSERDNARGGPYAHTQSSSLGAGPSRPRSTAGAAHIL